MSEKESVVEIEEAPEAEVTIEEPMTRESLENEGVSREQIKLAEKHGMLKEPKEEKDGEHAEQPKPETKEDKREESEEKSEEDKGEEEEVKPSTPEEMEKVREKDPEKFKKFDANEKALYHRWKSDKRKRQEAQKKAEELQQKLELSQVQDKGYKIKVDKIAEALKNPDLTVEQLQAIIGEQKETAQEVKEEVKDTSEDDQKNFVANRILQAEEYGKDVVENFEEMVALATEVVQSKPVHQKTLNQALLDESVSEPELVDLVMDIARLHKDFGKPTSETEESPKANEKVERIEKNAKKAKSSAAVSGGRSVRKVSEDDLTPEHAVNMSNEQWSKLKPSTRKRLMGG